MKKRQTISLFSFLFLTLLTLNVFSQNYVFEEKVYLPLIKTVKLESKGADFSLPLLRLNTNDRITLKFDVLSEETEQYGYTIIHCNSDWTQSNLNPQEYIEGFEQGIIENHANSINTIQRYVHYWQMFPNNMMRFLVSGNYIIKVYEYDNPDNVAFISKFMVYENGANIRANVMMGRSPEDRNTKQEVDVLISPSDNISFLDPNRYIKVFVQQNGRKDNISLLKLRQYNGRELEYSFDKSNIFDASNEFRNFDFSSLRLRSQNVSNFDFIQGENVVKLKPIYDRSKLPYTTLGDINGYYYVRNDRDDNYDLSSDYAWVDFYLKIPQRVGGRFYVWGELSSWDCNEQNIMQYDDRYSAYTASLYLKQGFYNYMIMFMPTTLNPFYNIGAVEGNFSQTNNVYHIFVYYRKMGDTFDSLIGYAQSVMK
ncbi:MAG: DUF5103 domain-containing protein [Bacteroidales bacterium]|jgi:hypothetical protein|nr:DUF5103 domain-containing protein [Bacteroidales bacterium]